MNNLSLNNSIFLVNPIAGKLSLNNKIKTIKSITEGCTTPFVRRSVTLLVISSKVL